MTNQSIQIVKNEIIELTTLLTQTNNEKIRKTINKQISNATKNLYYLQAASNRLEYIQTLKNELNNTNNELIKELINKEISNVSTKKVKSFDYDIEIIITNPDYTITKLTKFTHLFELLFKHSSYPTSYDLITKINKLFPTIKLNHLNIFDNRFNTQDKIKAYFLPVAMILDWGEYHSITIKSNSLNKKYELINLNNRNFILNNDITINI